MPTQTGVTTQTISSTKMAIATVFMGVAAVAAAAAGALTSGPDLVIENFTVVPTVAQTESPYSYSFTVRNVGGRPAKGPFYVSYRAYTQYNTGIDINLDQITAPGFKIIKPSEGPTSKHVVLIQIPQSYFKANEALTVTGDVSLSDLSANQEVYVDAYNRVKEIDEYNNVSLVPIKISSADSCSDTDDGLDLSVRGTTTQMISSSTIIKADYCETDKLLIEYSCKGNISVGTGYICPGSEYCNNGICTTVTTTLSTSLYFNEDILFKGGPAKPSTSTLLHLVTVAPDDDATLEKITFQVMTASSASSTWLTCDDVLLKKNNWRLKVGNSSILATSVYDGFGQPCLNGNEAKYVVFDIKNPINLKKNASTTLYLYGDTSGIDPTQPTVVSVLVPKAGSVQVNSPLLNNMLQYKNTKTGIMYNETNAFHLPAMGSSVTFSY